MHIAHLEVFRFAVRAAGSRKPYERPESAHQTSRGRFPFVVCTKRIQTQPLGNWESNVRPARYARLIARLHRAICQSLCFISVLAILANAYQWILVAQRSTRRSIVAIAQPQTSSVAYLIPIWSVLAAYSRSAIKA